MEDDWFGGLKLVEKDVKEVPDNSFDVGNGGKVERVYVDDDGNVTDAKNASRVLISRFDANGNFLGDVFGEIRDDNLNNHSRIK